MITRVLGAVDPVVVDWWTFPPSPGQRFLICSDGLTNEVEDGDLAGALSRVASAQDVANALLELALERGARDNVSLIVLDIEGTVVETSDEETNPNGRRDSVDEAGPIEGLIDVVPAVVADEPTVAEPRFLDVEPQGPLTRADLESAEETG